MGNLGRPRKPPSRARSIYPEDEIWEEMRELAIAQRRSITGTWEEAARLFISVQKNIRNIPSAPLSKH